MNSNMAVKRDSLAIVVLENWSLCSLIVFHNRDTGMSESSDFIGPFPHQKWSVNACKALKTKMDWIIS